MPKLGTKKSKTLKNHGTPNLTYIS